MLLVSFVLAASMGVGCRDFHTGAGERLIEDHVLAGRTDPALSSAELREGSFQSFTPHVLPLQRDLTQVGVHFGVKSTMWPSAAGEVEVFDPTNALHYSAGPQIFGSSLSTPFTSPIDVAALEAEVAALCAHPLLATRMPASACAGFGLDQLAELPFDDYTLSLISNEVQVFWDAPRTHVEEDRYDDEPGSCELDEEGVLRSTCGGSFACPRDEAGEQIEGTCVWTRLCSIDEECRNVDFIDAGICADTVGFCSAYNRFVPALSEHDRQAPVLVVRAPFRGDFDPDDLLGAVLQVNIPRLTFEIRLQPVACEGPNCRFRGDTLFEAYRSETPQDVVQSGTGLDIHVRSDLVERSISIQPGPLCFLPIPLPPEAVFLFPPLTAALSGPVPLAGCITGGEILRGILEDSVDRLATTPGTVLDGFMQLPVLSVDVAGFGRLDLSQVLAGSELRPLGGTTGAWTTDTMRLLARGGGLMRMSIDLSSLNSQCQRCPEPGNAACIPCLTMCGGEEGLPTCDLTDAGICLDDPLSGSDDHCEALDLRLDEATFGLALDMLASPVPTNAEKRALWRQITTPFAPSPNAAKLFDGVLGIGVAIQRLFTTPLDAADTAGRYRFTDTLWCGPSDERPDTCRSGESGAVFRFLPDRDADGTPDEGDNCPELASSDLTDSDGDGFGDACDTCPWTPDPYNNGNNCRCDIDGDGCNNPLGIAPIASAPPEVPRSCEPRQGEVYDERPTRSSGNTDADGDGIVSDCDPDNDGDGVPDGADNCPDEANADQRDQNGNGIGDACDLCSAGQPICFVSPEDLAFANSRFRFGPGSSLPSQCVSDGPGCFGFLVGRCEGQGPGCLTSGLDVYFGGSMLSFTAKALGGDAVLGSALLPDLTHDGLPELAVTLRQGQGSTLLVLDTTSDKLVWSYTDETGGFGAGLAIDAQQGLIVVSAPSFSTQGEPSDSFDPFDRVNDIPDFDVVGDQASLNGALFVFDFHGAMRQPVIGASGARLGEQMLVLDDGTALVGAPGQSAGGAVHRVDLQSGVVIDSIVGKQAGIMLGAGPMVAADGYALLADPEHDGGFGAIVSVRLQPTGFGPFHDRAVGGAALLGQGAGKLPSALGAGLSAAADFGDRQPRFAVGAPGAYDGRGTVLLYDPRTRVFSPTGIVGLEGARLGSQLAAIGDDDDDGHPDLVASLPGAQYRGVLGAHVVLYGIGKKLETQAAVPEPTEGLSERVIEWLNGLGETLASALESWTEGLGE